MSSLINMSFSLYDPFCWTLIITAFSVLAVAHNLYRVFAVKCSDKHLKLIGQNRSTELQDVLLVIAHPDDECMFFGPTIIRLISFGWRVHVLCLTLGGYYGEGSKRRDELLHATALLGVTSVKIIDDDKDLQDGSGHHWPAETVKRLIKEQISQTRSHFVITFDQDGVSSHCDHCALHRAALDLASDHMDHSIHFYRLNSVILLRKYSSIVSALVTIFSFHIMRPTLFPLMYNRWTLGREQSARPTIFVLTLSEWSGHLLGALKSHESQMMWFRKFYSYFSCYMFVNTLYPIN